MRDTLSRILLVMVVVGALALYALVVWILASWVS